jgi:hypothetical protein
VREIGPLFGRCNVKTDAMVPLIRVEVQIVHLELRPEAKTGRVSRYGVLVDSATGTQSSDVIDGALSVANIGGPSVLVDMVLASDVEFPLEIADTCSPCSIAI